MSRRTLAAVATALIAAATPPALAAHANPWAGEDDITQARNHDDNQERSVDTPGEDAMRGTMTRSAHGKPGGGSGSARGGATGGGQGGPR